MEHTEQTFLDFLYGDFRLLPETSHKGRNGRTLLIGASRDYPSSIILAAEGAISTGVGYVALSPLEDSYGIVANRAPLQCIYKIDMDKTNSVLFGNGVSDDLDNKEKLSSLLFSLDEEKALIIDATGINIFKKLENKEHRAKMLLTPHLGEASSLLGLEKVPSGINELLDEAKKFASIHKVNLLIKGVTSYLVDEGGDVHPSFYGPTASLAKAGSGDVLAGFLAGLLARYHDKDISLVDLVSFGDWLFHFAMKEMEEIFGNAVISATDFPKALRIMMSQKAPEGA